MNFDHTTVLSKKEFDSLPEYSCSFPTKTTIGKEWKCERIYGKPEQGWLLCEYTDVGKPGRVGIFRSNLEVEDSLYPLLKDFP